AYSPLRSDAHAGSSPDVDARCANGQTAVMSRARRTSVRLRAHPSRSEIGMISSRLSQYFEQRGVRYEISQHRFSRSSVQTARVAHVPPFLVAKSVILEDDGGFVMAVIPADRYVMVGRLASLLGRHKLHLSDEERVAAVFGDCDRGAVPPVGMAWGIE